jgi:4-hydroxy-3-methylbut-2-enyl diphosphate reductase
MAREFDIPTFYKSPIISLVKDARKVTDPRKKDLSPSVLDFGPLRFKIARHFGFCFGVENAIEIAYQAIEEHPDKRIFLLSEMIHNPHVNEDLRERGVQFLRTTSGEQLIPLDELTPEDIVVVPAFGTTIEIQEELRARGIDPETYDTTCPFVEKVWRKSAQIGGEDYSIVVHGKRYHEETRATFSHARQNAPVVVIRDLDEARDLARVIRGDASSSFFYERFDDRYSEGFAPERDLRRLGVVNQTTMLATETQAIASLLREAVIERYGEDTVQEHFADTSDTLCYATYENQEATTALIEDGSDLAIVVGGYNSSNTGHLVELCEEQMPTYFVRDKGAIDSPATIRHFDIHSQSVVESEHWLPTDGSRENPTDIILTSGASCPDALLDEILVKIVSWFPDARHIDEVVATYRETIEEASEEK